MGRVLGLCGALLRRDDDRVGHFDLGILVPAMTMILTGVLMLGVAYRGTPR